ncbi:type II secretion system F family protein [Flavobacterium sp. D11R37]|uniref:type II secretion system F family protein n=1 Tax=Flavobacterium coralii TaxID=2838017 RepID=UPI001CA671B0|nr:type II secretion system F family protein [Flavobacterium coralii]MBY8962531.1 type II secretion system F family protein [Flavobacterium coralii]
MAFKLDKIDNKKADKSFSDTVNELLKKEIVLFGGGFGNKKKQRFYLELSVLLNAGITIKEALSLITESQKKEKDKLLIKGVEKEVINGKPFSEALYNTKQFSEYEYFSLKIGEETGTTARISKELGEFYERKNEQKRVVVSALTYPSIVLSTAILVIIFMLSYVVPMFEDIFKQNNMELPFLTKIIVELSAIVKSSGPALLLFSVIIFFAVKYFSKKYAFKKFLHEFLLKVPVAGSFISKVNLAQFTQAVALLTASKVPLLNSIQMVHKMTGFVPLKEALNQVERKILKGESLSESLKGSKLFDNRIISLVKVAEETNQTEYIFSQLNQQYSDEVLQQSKLLSTVLEPIIIVIVGLIVAVLLVAMYLPMFQISSAIG